MEPIEILEKLNENSKECIIKNRRKGPDFLLNVLNFIGIIIWFFILMLFAICEKAGVEMFDFTQKIENTNDIRILNIAIMMASILFFVSASLLIISLRRTRRKNDKIKISLLISEIISFFVGILLLVKLY